MNHQRVLICLFPSVWCFNYGQMGSGADPVTLSEQKGLLYILRFAKRVFVCGIPVRLCSLLLKNMLFLSSYGRLTLAWCQVPTKLLSHSPSSTGQGRENMMKGKWVEIRTGILLRSYHHGQKRFDSGKL